VEQVASICGKLFLGILFGFSLFPGFHLRYPQSPHLQVGYWLGVICNLSFDSHAHLTIYRPVTMGDMEITYPRIVCSPQKTSNSRARPKNSISRNSMMTRDRGKMGFFFCLLGVIPIIPFSFGINIQKKEGGGGELRGFSYTSISGEKPMSGRFSVHSDSFLRQDVEFLVRLSCSGRLSCACYFSPAFRNLTVVHM
jgi:hypothetical protein